MKKLISLILIFVGISSKAEIPAGSYNGYLFLENRIRQRMIKAGENSMWMLIGHLNGSIGDPDPNNLEGLLGMYNSGAYQNGLPNSLNWTLYNLMFTRFSADFAESCVPWGQSPTFQHSATEIAKAVCLQAKDSGEISPDTLMDLWLLTMGYDARFSEFESWVDFANSESVRDLDPQSRLALIVKTVFLNPYTLIRH